MSRQQPYRVNRRIHKYTSDRGEEHQVLIVTKTHLFDSWNYGQKDGEEKVQAGRIRLRTDINPPCKVEEDGKPVYQFTQMGVYIHLRDGLKPTAEGDIIGRIEINWRDASKFIPRNSEKNYSDEELLALPEDELKCVASDEFDSVNAFPVPEGTPVTHEVRIERVESDTRGSLANGLRMLLSKHRKQGGGFDVLVFGPKPDRNRCLIFVHRL